MSFLDELQKNTNRNTFTENAFKVTNDSTLDANLDYFSLAGAMRNRPVSITKSFAEPMQLTHKQHFELCSIYEISFKAVKVNEMCFELVYKN